MRSSETQSKILDAVLDVVSDLGMAKLSMEAVADRADVSRQTVYRYFDNRERLVEQAILREEQAFIHHMLVAASTETTLAGAVRAAVTTALQLSRAHPVLSHVIEEEPASLLPYLLLGRGPVISAAEPAVKDLVRRFRPSLSDHWLQRVADITTRLLVSYVVSPQDVDDDALGMEMASVVLHLVDSGSELAVGRQATHDES